MKILYICHRFPFPPKRGGKIRPFNMIKHLSDAGHEVSVASLARTPGEAEEGHGIAPHCARFEMAVVNNPVQVARMVLRLPTPVPSSMGYFYSGDLAWKVRGLLAREGFDLIFVHCSSVAQYVAGVHGTPKILDFGDMDSQKWLEYARYEPFPFSAGYRLEGIKLEREERRLATLFDTCTATTPAEWETLEGYRTGVASDWFPNGVDSGYFAPGNEPYEPDTLCFVGRMDYYPNQECMFDFCANVLPGIWARRPRARLLIVGADPSKAVRKLGELPGVTVTGSVPDVRPYLQRSALMVAPLNIARGTQNKFLEAMASGVPVVVSGGLDLSLAVWKACRHYRDNPFLHFVEASVVVFNGLRRMSNPAIQPLTLSRGVHAARDRYTPRYAHRHELEEVKEWFRRGECDRIEAVDWKIMFPADHDDFRRNVGVRGRPVRRPAG